MKKLSIFFLFGLGCIPLYAQETVEDKIVKKSELPQTRSVEKSRTSTAKGSDSKQSTTISVRPGEVQVVHDNAYYLAEIDKIDHQIEMIDQKIDFVNSSPEEKAKATESAWFDQMEAIKSDLREKRRALKDKLN